MTQPANLLWIQREPASGAMPHPSKSILPFRGIAPSGKRAFTSFVELPTAGLTEVARDRHSSLADHRGRHHPPPPEPLR